MIKEYKEGIQYYWFHNLADYPGIWHGIFSRHGGISERPFNRLNVTFNLGDKTDNVIENRGRVSQAAGGFPITYAHQNHGTKILIYREGEKTGISIAKEESMTGDALVTNQPGKFMAVQVADCQSVLLYEPEQQVIANIHSGWRGSIRNILGRTIDIMKKEFDCRPPRIIAGIGPSLGPCCAEFIHYRKEIPEPFWKYRNAGNLFDFWSISMDQLSDAGVRPENIETSGFCTKCRTDLFFSYRGERVTGRFASVIGIRP